MVLRKGFLLVVAALLLLVLSACAEVNEEIWINRDGTGKIRYDIGLSETLFTEGEPSGSDLFAQRGMDASNPYLKNIVTNQFSDGELRHFTIEADVIDFSKVFDNPAGKEGGLIYRIEKLPDGNYRFEHTLDLDALNAREGSAAPADADMREMLAVALEGQYWTITLHSDQVVSTNGTWDPQSKTVVWQVPLAQIFMGSGQLEMNAEYRTGFPLLLLGIGVAVTVMAFASIVMVILAALVLFVLLNRRDQKTLAG